MKKKIFYVPIFALPLLCYNVYGQMKMTKAAEMRLNEQEYLEYEGVNVMLALDYYPESHQGGIGVIQNGLRVATNGDLRLEPTPGQWQPTPKVGERKVDLSTGEVSVRMEYPNEDINRKGFNPVIYPDLKFSYTLRVKPDGKSFRIIVDLDNPLPDEWIGKVGLNFELFPQILFGKSYYMDDASGIFPRQPNGPSYKDVDGELQITPLATGRKLTVAPESDSQRMIIENVTGNEMQLIDGRGKHNNGWYVVRSLVPKNATQKAVEWRVTPNAIKGYRYRPVVQVSQVGYHPSQQKIAVIEVDSKDNSLKTAMLLRLKENGGTESILVKQPHKWGRFLRYNYLQFDFSAIKTPGMYVVRYGDYQTEPFKIGEDVYSRHVWQPTLEYFLPAQMCHVRVNERYRVWHGWCHLDDARMAPVDSNHFDGYIQGSSTLTKYKPGDNVPLLDRGGWHDAGDYDMRIESQAETVQGLALAFEQFRLDYDNTSIDQSNLVVEIQEPDGKPDALQQIEHGLLTILGGYKALGRLYRGIIEPTKRQYVLLGDPANLTDNVPYRDSQGKKSPTVGLPGSPDDRWVFTEDNPGRELGAAAALAAASRVMKGYNDSLSRYSLAVAEDLWNKTKEKGPGQRVEAAVELFITTKDRKYLQFILDNRDEIIKNVERHGWVVGRILTDLGSEQFNSELRAAASRYRDTVVQQGKKTPYGVPYEPNIWGAGWGIQNFGFHYFFWNKAFPDLFPTEHMFNALNFILGCHPGSNTASFASGVGSRSVTTAYGFNRADWSYIPGGIVSGTALIRPDFPELLTWPFLWQQTEYVLGGGTTDYLFLVLAADNLLTGKIKDKGQK
jgi:endoglucanase